MTRGYPRVLGVQLENSTAKGGAEKRLADMGAEELLSLVSLDVNSAIV
jgi:hypothetical protein